MREHALHCTRALDTRAAWARSAEPYCTWCGKKAAHVRALVQGPGTAICSDCIEPVTVIANGG
ncbi:ClpX C4-type zinc finger protein [Streptacidiphilus sp. PAMC 29251]